MLKNLIFKFDFNHKNSSDNLTLMKRRKNCNKEARDKNGLILFNSTVTIKNNISQDICIFTISNTSCWKSSLQKIKLLNFPNKEITVYTDIFCLNNGGENAQADSSVYYRKDEPQNLSL